MKKFADSVMTKALFAVAVVAVAGIVGGVNFASAQSDKSIRTKREHALHNGGKAVRPTKQYCTDNGFRNYGQCVRIWAQDNSGYGRIAD